MIGERIKSLRKAKNISQAELAKQLGVSAGNVGDWERGRAKPGLDALILLVEYFKISADYLLSGKENINNPYIKENTSNILLQPLNDTELELLNNFRQLNLNDQNETRDTIKQKLKISKEKLKISTEGKNYASHGI